MQALVDTRYNRVCQLSEQPFPVAAPLIWVDVPQNETVTTRHRWTEADGFFVPTPPVEPPPTQEEVNEASICSHLDAEIPALKSLRVDGEKSWSKLPNVKKDELIVRLLHDVEYLCRIVRRKLNET